MSTDPANDMVERVARAICQSRCDGEAYICHRGDDGYTCLPSACGRWPSYKDSARAAIAALREPTAKMLMAGGVHVTGYEGMRSAYECWQAMIDAALKDAPRET